jgi:hypothetical protein
MNCGWNAGAEAPSRAYSRSNPNSWRVVLRFAKERGVFSTYKFVDVASTKERATAHTLLKRCFWRTEAQAVHSVAPDGELETNLDATVERILESYANWYGD